MIEIKNRWDSKVIYRAGDAETIRQAVEHAVRSGANLYDADLGGANLGGANLGGADLGGADLGVIRDDLRAVLDSAPNEVSGLLTALRNGKIDGTAYSGDCACLVGTIANVRGCSYKSLGELKPDSSRPAERWFLAITPGVRPEWHPVARITEGWIVEWMNERGIPLPLSTEEKLAAALKRIAELEADAEERSRARPSAPQENER